MKHERQIPFRFIRDRTCLAWQEVQWGLDRGLLAPTAPVEIAIDQLSELEEPSSELLDLAALGERDCSIELVRTLAETEPRLPDERIRHKWLYLALAWAFENRRRSADPLQEVEIIYAHFGYPDSIAHFVRYMPMIGSDLGSREANERRLVERWRMFLEDASRLFSQDCAPPPS